MPIRPTPLLRALAIALLMVGLAACQSSGKKQTSGPRPPADTRVATEFSLDSAHHGISGKLQLLLDERLTKDNTDDFKTLFWFGFSRDPALEDSIVSRPLAPARLRTVDGGTVKADEALDSPFASLEALDVRNNGDTSYLLTVSLGGFGAFNGDEGRLIDIRNAWPEPMSLASPGSDQPQPMVLIRSAKTDWRIKDGAKPGDKVIFQVICETENRDPEPGFAETFIRYDFQPTANLWTSRKRSDRGYCNWEGPGGFPEATRFP